MVSTLILGQIYKEVFGIIKNKLAITLMCLLISLVSCKEKTKQKNENVKLYKKEISSNNMYIEWFYHSYISNVSPDFITVSKGDLVDTICFCSNIINVEFYHDSIFIESEGPPSKYQYEYKVPTESFDYPIVIENTLK